MVDFVRCRQRMEVHFKTGSYSLSATTEAAFCHLSYWLCDSLAGRCLGVEMLLKRLKLYCKVRIKWWVTLLAVDSW